MSFNIEKLIDMVRMHEILYDPSCEKYKNNADKDKIWEEIGRQLSLTGDDTKKKWKNLRDSYSKHLRCTMTGTATATVKKNYSHWQWAKRMEFVKPYLSITSTFTDIWQNDNSTNSELQESNSEAAYFEFCPMSQQEDCTILKVEDCSSDSQEGSSTHQERVSSGRFRKRKRKIHSPNAVAQYFEGKLKQSEMDAIEHLFIGYAKTVKGFSPRRQAMTKMKIAQLIMEQEIEHYDELAQGSQSVATVAINNGTKRKCRASKLIRQ